LVITSDYTGEVTVPSSRTVPPFDFDALYRGEKPAEHVSAVSRPPWDTKAPKAHVIAWQTAGLINGDVLDIGCGTGDNAVYLAQQGHHVTGLDISPTALITAEHRAKTAGVNIRFAVADATKLDGYTDAFDTVIDSGMFHCLDDAGKRAYARSLHRATRVGATLLLSCFSDGNAADAEWPLPVVSEQTLRDSLSGAGWHITSLEPFTLCLNRGDTDVEIGWPIGSRASLAFWRVQARRR
jgi:SAM-dependent methyltransferase